MLDVPTFFLSLSSDKVGPRYSFLLSLPRSIQSLEEEEEEEEDDMRRSEGIFANLEHECSILPSPPLHSFMSAKARKEAKPLIFFPLLLKL